MRRVFGVLCVILAGCEAKPDGQQDETGGSRLDEQAIASGLLPNPEQRNLAGQFETRSELGIDKFCAVTSGSGFDIGMLAVFGPESKCEGQGSASLGQDSIEITLRGEDSCQFKAEYDGVEIRVPGAIPEGCSSYCTPRASFSGTSYYLISQGDEAARKSLGRDIDRLCGE